VTDDALGVVDLYYVMQGTTEVGDEQRDAGLMAALELMAAGYDVDTMTDLVVQVHREIPGAATGAFELIFPPFVRATATPGTAAVVTPETRAPATATSTRMNTTLTPVMPPPTTEAARLRARGRGGLVTCAIFDLVGYATFLASTAASSAGFGVVGLVMVIGSTFTTLGSIIGTIAMADKHGAYVRAGYRPVKKHMAGSWTLTGICIALGIGAWTLPLIGGVIAGATVLVLEGINLLSVRPKWDQALAVSEAVGQTPRRWTPTTAVLPASTEGPAVLMMSVAF